MKFRAKVQMNFGHLFIYLPLAQCRDDNIEKGSKIYCITENTGLPPEKPLKKGHWPSVKKDENTEREQSEPVI